MTIILTPSAMEDSTYVVTAAFADEDGGAVTPNTIAWTLQTPRGDVINDRLNVAVGVPAESVDILLSGDDLDAEGAEQTTLRLTIRATYDSVLGSDLPLVAVCGVPVEGV